MYDKDIVTEGNGVLKPKLKGHVAVKEAVFPFNKLTGADLLLSPEMKSTGEVMGISDNFGMAFAKSQSAAKNNLPKAGKVFISLCDLDKEFAPSIAKGLTENGFTVVATGGTHKIIVDSGIACEKVSEKVLRSLQLIPIFVIVSQSDQFTLALVIAEKSLQLII